MPLPFAGRDRPWFFAASLFFAGYLLTLPVKHTVALGNLCLAASVALLAVSFLRENLLLPRMDKAIWFLAAYAAVATGAILASGIDVAESFNRVRSGLLEQIYVLFFSLLHLQNRRSGRLPLLALAAGFVVLTVVTAIPVATIWLRTPEVFSAGFHIREVSPGYGIHALFFLPLLFGSLLVFRPPGLLLAAGGAVVLIAFFLMLSYNSTSSVVFVCLYLVVISSRLLNERFRIGYGKMLALGVAGLLSFSFSIEREAYDKIRNQFTLVGEGQYYTLLSTRAGIWAIGVDCAADAPWYGYGYGQKKVALICSDDKYIQPARERNNLMADYYRKDAYGKIGFHNQYIENWFVSGWLGSFCWLAFFLGACRSAWRKREASGLQQILVLPLLLIFMAGCLFNGLWEAQPLTKGMMVILALALASPRETAKGGG